MLPRGLKKYKHVFESADKSISKYGKIVSKPDSYCPLCLRLDCDGTCFGMEEEDED